jgi:hypothetical protein
MRKLGTVGTAACLWALIAGGCGDDDSAGPQGTGEGCITDVECKGDRICVDGACVDPEDAPVGADGGTARGGSGGSRAGGGASGGSGDAGSSGRAGTGGSGPIDDPELERACGLNCEARAEASCAMNVGSLDQCLGQCLVIDEAQRGFCLDEQTAHYACMASGGYTCVSGYPQPKSTCIAEAQALSTCSQMTPCRDFCAKAAGECAPEGDECVTSCMDEQAGFQDAICGIYYTQLLSCWGQKLTCADGKPLVGECGSQVAQVADCIGGRNHACDGFCWAAEALGCGADDCVTTCKAKADATSCGSYYRRVIECAYDSRELVLSCVAGTPTPDATKCMSDIQQYEMCMTSQSGG